MIRSATVLAALLAIAPALAQQAKTTPPTGQAPAKIKGKSGASAREPAASPSQTTKQIDNAPPVAQKQSPTAAPSNARPILQPLPPLDTSAPPPMLPRASRERMRACAEEWEKKRRAASAGLPMWRAFATDCLAR